MIPNSIKYRFALIDGTDNVVDINELERDTSNGHAFQCPNCHKMMYATFGEQRVRHFRHNGDKCEPNRYLHATAEKIFFEEFTKCIQERSQFLIEYQTQVSCDRKCITKNKCAQYDTFSIDLTKEYDTISIENNVSLDGHFRRPDLLLKSKDGKQLWIEIWVTHETSPEKMKDASIIEFKINSENDLEQIRNHSIKATKTSNLDKAFPSGPKMVSKFNTDKCPDFVPELVDVPFRPAHFPNKKRKTQFRKLESSPISLEFDESKVEWVDLGLPSGTLWAKNKEINQVSLHTAKKGYGRFLPSITLANELRDNCVINWNSETRSIVLTGPNGKNISIECKNKDTVILWLDQYDNEGVRPNSWNYNRFGKCMKITPTTIWINDDEASEPNDVLLAHENELFNLDKV